MWQSPDQAPTAAPAVASTSAAEAAPPTWGDVVRWVFLAAVPSGLLVAVTAHISTDVAAVPLLWVIPLALYLLTFVIVFSRQPIIPHWLVVEVQPVFILALVAVIVYEPIRLIVGIMAVHLVVFFVATLMCHGELAQRRPAARYLTSFYMWMSFGGMIGGISSGLAAPYMFNWIAEYPILITLAVLCRPGLTWPKTRWQQIAVFGSIFLAVIGLVLFRQFEQDIDLATYNAMLGGLLILTVLFWRDPIPFAAIIATVLLAHHFVVEGSSTMTVRSFFGVLKVNETSNGRFRTLSHGTTLHGGQRIRDNQGNPVTGRPEPTMYYYDGSAIAQGMDAARAVKGGPINYAVIGLGTGSLICRSQPGDKAAYYEIDHQMVRLARDTGLFTFLKECGQDVPIVMGDARLTLADAKDGSYDIIVVDAFTSDAIPIHLLTREAMAIYLKKLSPQGIVLDPHLEPPPRACLGGDRHCRGKRRGDARQRKRRRRRRRQRLQIPRNRDGYRTQGRGFRPARQVAVLGIAAARSAATGVVRRLFEHRRCADPAVAAVVLAERVTTRSARGACEDRCLGGRIAARHGH